MSYKVVSDLFKAAAVALEFSSVFEQQFSAIRLSPRDSVLLRGSATDVKRCGSVRAQHFCDWRCHPPEGGVSTTDFSFASTWV
jgi:hypothetical protein